MVGKRGDCTMKDETEEMDRDHEKSLNFIPWTLGSYCEIRERYDKIWVLERLLWW